MCLVKSEMLVHPLYLIWGTVWTVARQAPLSMGFSPGKNTGGRSEAGFRMVGGTHVYL